VQTSALPSISIVIPCYNGMPYLPQALDSALAQTLKPLEIIVVDDGSRDDSAACVGRFQQQHPQADIRLIQQANGGESASRNAGIFAAKGQWVAQLDADDWWDPPKLELQARAALDAGPHCVLVHTAQVTEYPDGPQNVPFDGAAQRVGWCTDKLVEPVALSHSSVMARRDALVQIGGYDATIKHAVDIDVYFKLSAVGSFAFVPQYVTHYRIHGQQTSWKHKIEQVRHHHMVVRRFFAAHGELEKKIGRDAIDAALTRHVELKLESFWWNRRLAEFRQLLALADEQGYRSPGLEQWRGKARWPDWLIRARDRFSGAGART
jgi:glycosyltransferase involved in cell wall biosynthesis